MDALIKWWFIFWSCVVGAAFVYSFGLFDELWVVDTTKISFLILAIWSVVTVYIGVLTRSVAKRQDAALEHTELQLPFCWYSAGAMTALGMIGTVIGFLLMLGGAFKGINLGDVKAAQQVISDMAVGMATALTTTLVGLVCSEIVKLQLVNLEKLINEVQARLTNSKG